MITALRKSFKSRFYKIILWVTILATGGVFSAFEMVRLFLGASTSHWVVKVNGKAIDYAVFTRKVADEQERVRMIRMQYGQYADLILQMMHASSNPEVMAVDATIRETLLDQSARHLALAVSSDFMAEKLNDLMFIQKELSDLVPMYVIEAPGVVNMRALRVYLQRNNISMETFEALVIQAIKRHTLGQLVSMADYIPSFELKRQFIKDYVSKRYSVKKLSLLTILNQLKKKQYLMLTCKIILIVKMQNQSGI